MGFRHNATDKEGTWLAKDNVFCLAWNVSDKPDTDSILWYDLNSDGIVDTLDFTILFENWLASTKSPQSYLLGDINNDGVIGANDLELLLNHNNLVMLQMQRCHQELLRYQNIHTHRNMATL